jgi:hypothetical protein
MTSPDLPVTGDGEHNRAPDSSTDGTEPADRIATLRGAGVGTVDTRRVARVAIGIVLATLLVLVVVFAVAGLHRNEQADRLHQEGVPVTFTITACTGLLGGSGTNVAGYTCRGIYSLDGHRYSEQLPGNDFHRPGSTVRGIAVPGDPALVSPAAMVKTEHSSSGVFVLPAILLLVLVLLVGLLVLRRRAARGDDPAGGGEPA